MMQKREKAKKLQAVNDSFNAASATLDIITLFAGENEKLKKGLAITQVTIDTAQAIIGTWAGYANMSLPGANTLQECKLQPLWQTQQFKLTPLKTQVKTPQ